MANQVTPVPLAYYNRIARKGSGGKGSQRASVSPGIFGGSGGEAGSAAANPVAAGTLASRQIIDPALVGLGAEGVPGAMITETQQVIPNQTNGPTFRIGNEANGHIGIGDVLSSRANPNFDANKAIGGNNVPLQPTSGIGGWFRAAFGDKANAQNLAAQQAQGRQWAGEAQAKATTAEKIAAENRAFGQQKELFGLQAGENANRDAAIQARQDAQIAANEATRLGERDEDLIREELKAGEATDRFNQTLAANKAAMPPKGYKLDEVYPSDDGTNFRFKADPMTGKITKVDVDAPVKFTPPPGAAPDAPAKAPLALGEEVQGIAPEIPDMLRKLGGGISAQTAAPRQIVNDVGANLFGGRVVENPTALTRAVAHPIEGLSNFILSQQGLAPSQTSAGSPAIPSKLPEQTTEDYIKMLRKLKGGY